MYPLRMEASADRLLDLLVGEGEKLDSSGGELNPIQPHSNTKKGFNLDFDLYFVSWVDTTTQSADCCASMIKELGPTLRGYLLDQCILHRRAIERTQSLHNLGKIDTIGQIWLVLLLVLLLLKACGRKHSNTVVGYSGDTRYGMRLWVARTHSFRKAIASQLGPSLWGRGRMKFGKL